MTYSYTRSSTPTSYGAASSKTGKPPGSHPDPAGHVPHPELCYIPIFQEVFATQMEHCSLLLNVLSFASVRILYNHVHPWLKFCCCYVLRSALMYSHKAGLGKPYENYQITFEITNHSLLRGLACAQA